MNHNDKHELPEVQHLVLLSGLSGSGKTIGLHALEDLNYYCVDNLPSALLQAFLKQILENPKRYPLVAIAIDARDRNQDLLHISEWLANLDPEQIKTQLIFLTADRKTLFQRFSETRRRHPLTEAETALPAAMDKEQDILKPIKNAADFVIDTSDINLHQLRQQIWKLVSSNNSSNMTVILQSFAFKHGVPQDLDFLFDARCLPNPHWEPQLRSSTGKDDAVANWLGNDPLTSAYLNDIEALLKRWLETFARTQRSYITIGIGCTGGQHRSVYLVEQLAKLLGEQQNSVQTFHRELS